MRSLLFKILLTVSVALCASSCMIEIKYEAPRWKCTLEHNGVTEKLVCKEDSFPLSQEYSVPEFFFRDDFGVIFRFYDKNTGLKLQFANDGPFKDGQKYSFKRGDEHFDVAFDWLYAGKEYSCDSGWIIFKKYSIPGIDYLIDFEFDLSTPGGDKMEIRKGTFTVYYKVKPRNTFEGIE